MRKTVKRAFWVTAALSLLYSATAFGAEYVDLNLFYNGQNHAYHAKEITMMVDGEVFTDPNMPAVSIDGRTMLPMRGISEELGCEVTWNEAARQVYAVSDTHTVVFQIDNTTGYKNGEAFTMDVAPMIINDRTMLPVRALADALDLEVTWDDPTRTVYIGEAPSGTGSGTGGSSTGSQETVTTGAKLTGLSVPASKADTQKFTITASGAVSKYEEVYVSDDKVVLDFYGTTNGLSENITATNSSVVTAVRTAYHAGATAGESYTRVVFDLTGKKDYTVTQSSDKTKVYVEFSQTVVTDIDTSSTSSADIVKITGDGSLGAQVSTLQNPYRIVIDLPGVAADFDEQISTSGLSRISEIRTGWMNGTTFRVVLEADILTNLTYSETNGVLTVKVEDSTLDNLEFDSTNDELRLKAVESISVGSISHNDQYLNGYYELTLPGDYSDVYGYGKLTVSDDKIASFEISTSGGKTKIRFNQNIISCYSVKESGGYYVISIQNPQDVYDKVLLLDAGHGGNDPGTSGNGLTEKTMNLTMALKVEAYLNANSDIKVYLTRDSDTRPANEDRAKTANQIADLMVSIHMNAGVATASGTETLYATHSNDNASMLTSQQAAQIMQNYLTAALQLNNRGVKLRSDLLILNSTTVPAILVETCFLSNAGDALKISNSATQDLAAAAMGNAIIYMMDNYKLR